MSSSSPARSGPATALLPESRRTLGGRIVKRRAVGLEPSHPPRRPRSRPDRSSYGTPLRVWGMTCREPDYPPLPAGTPLAGARTIVHAASMTRCFPSMVIPVPSPPAGRLGGPRPSMRPCGRCLGACAAGSRARCARRSPSRCAGSLPTARPHPPAADPRRMGSLADLARQPPPPLPVPLSGGGKARRPRPACGRALAWGNTIEGNALFRRAS